MPELPEVETVRRILEPIVVGKRIEEIKIYREKNVITGDSSFIAPLLGKKFLSVGRVGKFLIFHLEDELAIVSHLRMEGKYFERETDVEEKHDIISFKLSSKRYLVYNDVRKFGIIGLYKEKDLLTLSPVGKVGKEPFYLSKEELFDSLKRKRKEPLKTALLDQTMIAGLGNIYVDETLFAASLNPLEEASNVTLDDASRIIEESKRILQEAIDLGGSTIKSYHPKEGVNGEMQNELKVYGHKRKPCPRCGLPLRKITVGGRGTTYCPLCQRKKGKPFVLGITGPIHSGKSVASLFFKEKGYIYISSDDEIHNLYKDEEVLEEVKTILGPNAVKNGKIDSAFLRKALGEDEKNNESLKAYLYPKLKEAIEKKLSLLKEDDKVVLEVPLLAGSGLEDLIDYVIIIVSDVEKQKERLLLEGRDADALLKLNENYPLKENEKLASIKIINAYPEVELTSQIAKLSFLFQ